MPLPLADVTPRVAHLVQQGITDGLHRGAQLYVSHQGTPLVNAGLGMAAPGARCTPDTIMLWMSATKPLTAVAVMKLVERGVLDLDAPVAEAIPAFGAQQKETITTRHILTHTAGFRGADVGLDISKFSEAVEAVCRSSLEPRWSPGQDAGYHVKGSWFILAALIEALDGRSFPEYLREDVTSPLGMEHTWVGVPADVQAELGARLGMMTDTVDPELEPVPVYHAEESVAANYPGGNGRGPALDLGRFYEAMLDGGRGVLQPATVTGMTTRHREGLYDRTFRHTMDWGLGFIPDNKKYGVDTVPYGYGQYCSAETFGHSGAQSSVGFADPGCGLVAVIFFNGMPGEVRHQVRMRQVLDALYLDLELAAH